MHFPATSHLFDLLAMLCSLLFPATDRHNFVHSVKFLIPKSNTSSLDSLEPATPLTAENRHNTKTHIKQRQRIRDQTPHLRHSTHTAEHARAAVRAPRNCQADQAVAEEGVQREQDADERCEDKREETVAEHGAGAADCEGRGEVGAISAVGVLLGLVDFFACEDGGHHGEDEVEAYGAEDGEAADVAEPELAGLGGDVSLRVSYLEAVGGLLVGGKCRIVRRRGRGLLGRSRP